MNLSLPGIATMISVGDMGMPRIPFSMLVYFIVYFVLGYFVYAGIYTAIAAPFNTDQEAQQLVMIPVILILGGFMMYPAVMNNPNGPMAVSSRSFRSRRRWSCSCAPRCRSRRPGRSRCRWRSCSPPSIGMAWFAGRVYRVGILMYGKKPTIPEILRWVRYSPGKATQPATPRSS